jgi:uncharacterized membrane protein YecN with MAPEG domain
MDMLTLLRLRHNTLKLMRRYRVWHIDSPESELRMMWGDR